MFCQDFSDVQAKKYIDTPTPKNFQGPHIYNTAKKILANFEDLMKVSREGLYVPPGFGYAFKGAMCKFCADNVRGNCGETR